MGVREGIEYIRAILIGRSPFDVRPLASEIMYGTLPPHPEQSRYDGRRWDTLYEPLALYSPTARPTGPIVWAMSAIEMALCDLVGKALRTPVYNLLGGKCRERIRVYLD